MRQRKSTVRSGRFVHYYARWSLKVALYLSVNNCGQSYGRTTDMSHNHSSVLSRLAYLSGRRFPVWRTSG